MDTTHSAACQQCQHADESCRPRYSDKGVMASAESDGAESGDDEDGERVDIALAGTGADLGESAEEAEAEEEEDTEGSGPARAAEADTFTPPAPSGRIRMPCPTTRSWKGKEVEKMRWE